jgi:hypothetical protein
MATSRDTRCASRANNTNTASQLTREEFHKLMQHDSEDYTHPEFAGMSVWSSSNVWPPRRVKPCVATKPVPSPVVHSHIKINSLRPQQSEEKTPLNSPGPTSKQASSHVSSDRRLKQPRATAVLVQGDGCPSEEYPTPFYKFLDGYKIDQSVPARRSASPEPISPKHGQSDIRTGPKHAESLFLSCNSRPLTGNGFYDRRPPPGFSLLNSVQQSVAAYNETLGMPNPGTVVASTGTAGSRSSATPSATLKTPNSTPLKSASRHRPAANYHGYNVPPASASQSGAVGRGKGRKPEHSPADLENRNGGVASQSGSGPALQPHENQANSASIRKPPKTNGRGSHRQFTPTKRRMARRISDLRKSSTGSGEP